MSDTERFEHESIETHKSISEYLTALQEGFENGRIQLTTEKKEISLLPNDLLQLSIKARKKGDKSKLTIKVSWRESDEKEKEDARITIQT